MIMPKFQSLTKDRSPALIVSRGDVLQRKCACGGTPGPTGECEECCNKRLGIVQEVLQSPGQPLDVKTRAIMEPRFGHDFSKVRIHTDAQAAESTSAINALAYTVGHHIVFGTGQHEPATQEGQKLIAHELTHVIQQSQQTQSMPLSPVLNYSIDRHEQEADHAARQVTAGNHISTVSAVDVHPLIQRQPAGKGGSGPQASVPTAKAGAFDTEDPLLRTRRLDAIGALRNAVKRLTTGLSGGYLWSFELPTPTGVDLSPLFNQPTPETTAHRSSRLKQLLNDLIRTINELESATIPAGWLVSPVAFKGKGTFAATGPQAWVDAQMFYAHRGVGLGMDMDTVTTNIFYIETDPIPTKKIKPLAIMSGVQLGIYIVVPNPDKEPLVYRPLTKHEAWNAKGEIFEVSKDDLGYYYMNKGKKHYLPGRPSPVGY